jgi:uncharacterized protein YbjT (DUF2867 family)
MNVLICGAGGFIGGHIARQLRAAGHLVREARRPPVDFSRDLAVEDWLPRLDGIDAVVNAVGVLRETRQRPMQAVHHLAPQALFNACAQRGVRRVLHVSALGIDGNQTLYARSKLQAEEALRELHARGLLEPTILRPSIVYGRGGASTQMFMGLAQLPVLLLPAPALRARVQPVAVTDVAAACVALLESASPPLQLTCVGPQALPLAEFIASLRQQLGKGAARAYAIPEWMTRWSAGVGDHLPFQPWCNETLAMLQQDNVGDVVAFAELLGHAPVPPEQLVAHSWRK